MLSTVRRPSLSAARDALRDARETYRRYSVAEVAGQRARPPAEPGDKAADRPLRTPAVQRRGAARRAQPPGDAADRPPVAHAGGPERPSAEPDVVLDISRLHVDEIDLKLDELKARVALEAHVLDLLRLDAGVDAELRGVSLNITGVDAEALLKVRLENLASMVDRLMTTIERNPEVLKGFTERLAAAVEQLGGATGHALGGIGPQKNNNGRS